MANKPLRSLQFPGLDDTYTIPQIDSTLAVAGDAADAKKTGDEIASLKEDITDLQAIVAPFDALVSYRKYDLVTKSGVLYRFTANHSGAWSGTDVETVGVAVKNDLFLTDGLRPKFRIGNIAIRDTGWTYEESTTRVSTIEGYTIHLRPGDVI